MSKISVVVPVYNVENFLCECIDSLINQTSKDFELILVDDGSTDASGAICNKYAENDTRIRVIHKTNAGLSSARNDGIKNATGDYITFIDSDDYVSLRYLEQINKVIACVDADIIIIELTSDSKLLSNKVTDKYKEYSAENALKEILKERKFTTSACGKLFKASLFDNIRFPEGRIYEDYATVPLLFGAADKIEYVAMKGYFYRYNPNSITGIKFSSKRMQYFSVSKIIIDYLKSEYPKLVRYAVTRRTRYAISFYRQISKSKFQHKVIERFLVNIIRNNIMKYILTTRYSVLSKLYGIFIALCPSVAKLI